MEENNYEQFDEQLDRYLRHEMTAEEEAKFKDLLDSDEELRQRAQITALMIKSMYKSEYTKEEQQEDESLVDTIKNMNEEEFLRIALQKHKSKIVRFWPRFISYAAAACVVGVLAFSGYRMYDNHLTVSLGNTQYLAYVQDISDEQYVRGTNECNVVDTLQGLFANVKEGKDIKQTISELEPLYQESLNEESDYYDFCDDIAWNLAIAYLKDGNREKPIPLLEGMINRNVDYPQIAQPAQNLIDQIKGL